MSHTQITFRICAAVVTNAPSPDPMTIQNVMISHKTVTKGGKGKNFHEVHESGQFDHWDVSYSGGYY